LRDPAGGVRQEEGYGCDQEATQNGRRGTPMTRRNNFRIQCFSGKNVDNAMTYHKPIFPDTRASSFSSAIGYACILVYFSLADQESIIESVFQFPILRECWQYFGRILLDRIFYMLFRLARFQTQISQFVYPTFFFNLYRMSILELLKRPTGMLFANIGECVVTRIDNRS